MKTTDTGAYPDEAIEPYCRQLHDTAKRLLPPGTHCFPARSVKRVRVGGESFSPEQYAFT